MNYSINKLTHEATLKVTLHLTREFYIRKWIAIKLIKLATLILGCGIQINDEGNDGAEK